MSGSIDWLLVCVLASLELPILATVGWVSWVQREEAGFWWVICGAGVLIAALAQLPLPYPAFPLAVDGAAPLLGWTCYRGATAFSGTQPFRPALGLALAATAAWCLFFGLDLYTLRTLAGSGVAALFLGTSIWVLKPSANGGVQQIFAVIWALPIVVLVGRTFLIGDFSPDVETEIWIIALLTTGLMAIGALLERRAEDALLIAEGRAEQLRIGSEIARLGTWSLAEGSDLPIWTSGMYRIYELDPQKGVPSLSQMRQLVFEEDRERISEVVGRAISKRENFDLEFKSWTGNGNLRSFRSRGRSVLDPVGRWNFVGTTMDVSVYSDAMEELKRYRTDLEMRVARKTRELEASQGMLLQRERLAFVGTLTAGLAHQMNNPVGAILAAAEFATLAHAEKDEDALATATQALADIAQEAERCGEIVRNMMQFASERPSEKKPIQIDETLDAICQRARRIDRESKAELTLRCDGESPLIHASPIQIEQAIGNLVENALQSEGRDRRISIERNVVGDCVEVSVRDNGCGIAAEHLPHILDPFFTTRLEAGGTGLGMSVAHGIVAEHGGKIAVESEQGVGTRVTVSIPLSR